MPEHAFLSKREWLLFATLMTVVSSLTAAERAHLIPLSALASSPHAVAEARLWSLVTSALLVSSPLFWSLVSFALFGALTLRFCGSRVLLISAFAGHIASTLVVYALLALARTFDSRAFEAVLKAPDYGVSAVSAAWLGAIASASWRARNSTPRGRIATALAVVGVALFGWILRRHVSFLDLEHVVAFGIGVVVAVGRPEPPMRGESSSEQPLSASLRPAASRNLGFVRALLRWPFRNAGRPRRGLPS